MQKQKNDTERDMVKHLKKLVMLSENSLIISLSQQDVPHQTIRKVAGVDMSRVTSLLRGVKSAKKTD
ncbi:MAG: hypothetical protein PHR44_04380 [Candidatus Omnitrophica bacterium]|nr:hypothetical protein [Candidatus Omnitrophota bacterium]